MNQLIEFSREKLMEHDNFDLRLLTWDQIEWLNQGDDLKKTNPLEFAVLLNKLNIKYWELYK